MFLDLETFIRFKGLVRDFDHLQDNPEMCFAALLRDHAGLLKWLLLSKEARCDGPLEKKLEMVGFGVPQVSTWIETVLREGAGTKKLCVNYFEITAYIWAAIS